MRCFNDYKDARKSHAESGGWLLDLGGGTYGVTDDEGTVADMRGQAFVARCQSVEVWDETLIKRLRKRSVCPKCYSEQKPGEQVANDGSCWPRCL
jgi:hypothetical protein